MKFLKTFDEFFASVAIWPIIITGVWHILTGIFRLPAEWYTVALAFFLVIYFGIKVGIGDRL